MSNYLRFRIFKGPSLQAFRNAIQQIAEKYGGGVIWDKEATEYDKQLYTSHNKITHTLVLPYDYDGDWLFCEKVGAELDVPWIEARIQDSTLWDYSLYSGSEHLHSFSTLPEYWDDAAAIADTTADECKQLASVWRVRNDRIKNYVRRWGYTDRGDGSYKTTLKGKAYPEDEYKYGDFEQIYDFLRALGSANPLGTRNGGIGHTIDLPTIRALKSER